MRHAGDMTWLQGVDEDARELLWVGLSARQLAAFSASGSLAARLALCRLRGSPDPAIRAEAAAWLERLGTFTSPADHTPRPTRG